MFSPPLRRVLLTAHVTASVGWLGAVAAFLALAVNALTSANADAVRAAYISMNSIGETVIVPLSLASLLTGLVQSLKTPWGLFRHYWVATKFVLTVVATILLLLHQFTAVAAAADIATRTTIGSRPGVGGIGTQLVVDAALGIVVLAINTALSIFKPWGRTAYGRRMEAGEPSPDSAAPERPSARMPFGLKVFLALIGAFVLVIAIVHLAGGGFSHH